MELIPVFSLIVLVATIGTFILAVGAYIMFRLREARATTKPAQPPAAFDADVYAPQIIDGAQHETAPAIVTKRDMTADPRVMHLPDTFPQGDGGIAPEDRRRWR